MVASVSVSIAPDLAVQAEGSTGTRAFIFTVTRTGDIGAAQTVEWIVAGYGAQGADGLDFGGAWPAGTVSFAAGEASATLTVLVTGDGLAELDEDFSVTLFNPSTGLVVEAGSASATIQNDDKALVSIAAATATLPEGTAGTTPLTFFVSLDQPAVSTQTVVWSASGSGVHPASASDFAGPFAGGAVTFARGEISKTIVVDVVGDTMVELDESFTVTLSNASSGLMIGTATANGTILNDDKSVVSIAVLSAANPEGSSGTTAFTFIVTLDRPSASGQAVDWSVAGASSYPANAADFGGSLPTGSLSFAIGETSKVVTIVASADGVVELDEGFVVTLSNASPGLAIEMSSATGTIRNDDKAVASVAAQTGTAAEGTDLFSSFTFVVTLDRPAATGQTVAWSVAGSGANPADATDFGGTLPSGFVSFAAGETSKPVTVWVAGDGAVERDEGFTLSLSTVTADIVLGNASAASATIVNDDRAVVSIAARWAEGPEGDGGPTVFTFIVSLDRAGATAQSVTWTVAGSASQGADAADFGGVLPSGAMSFAAGEISKLVTVGVTGDTAAEADEAFVVTLSNATSGLALGQATASGTISNDDRPVVSIAALSAEQAEGDAGTTPFTFTISLDHAPSSVQMVDWWVSGTGAHAADAADLGGAMPWGAVTFAAGETSKTLTVQVPGDGTMEADETFTVTLADSYGGLAIGIGSAGGTIRDDDTATGPAAATGVEQAEGNAGATSLAAHDDTYVALQGQGLHVAAAAGVLANDEGMAPTTAAVVHGPAHGTLTLAEGGGFDYAPAAGFFGVDGFTYRASGADGSGEAEVVIHVTPLSSMGTLSLPSLAHDEQVSALYVGFLGRAADAAGFDYWLDESQSMSLTAIARSFGGSEEARGPHSLLADSQGADDGAIAAFLDSLYGNLFGRAADADGKAYWTREIVQALLAGAEVSDVVLAIIGGARNSDAGQDITTLMGKVAVNLEYVDAQAGDAVPWSAATDGASAAALIAAVTAGPQTVLVGIANADRPLSTEA